VSGEDQLQRARLLLELQKWEEALPLLQELTNADPENSEAWALVCAAFVGLGDLDRALRAAELAVLADPYGTEPHLWRGKTLLARAKKGDCTQGDALAAIREGVEMTNGDTEVRRLAAHALLESGKIEEAEDQLWALLKVLPFDPDVLYLQGEIYRRRGDSQRATELFQQAVFRGPDCATAWAGIGEVRSREKAFQEAAECFYHAVRSDPLEDTHRKRFFECVHAAVERTPAEWLQRFFISFSIVFGFCCVAGFPPALLALIAFIVWGNRAIYRSYLSRALQPMLPDAQAYYHAGAAVYKKEAARDSWQGCGILLLLLAILVGGIWGAGELSRRHLWANLFQIVLVGALLLPWLWGRLAPKPQRVKERYPFRFPGEAPADGAPAGAPLPDAAGLEGQALDHLCAARPEEARKTAELLLAQDPEYCAGLALYSLAALACGDVEDALAAARSVRELEPEAPRSHVLVWLHLAAGGRMEEALAEAEEAGELGPGAAELLSWMVSMLRLSGAAEAARAGRELLEKLAPGSAERYALDGEWAMAEGRLEDAEAAYRKAVALDPESAEHECDLGAVVYARRRRRQALRHWSHALRLDPTYSRAADALNSEITIIELAAGVVTALALGIVGLMPTLAGAARNAWMPWITWTGPLPIAGAMLLTRWIAVRWLAPVLREADRPDPTSAGSVALIGGLPVLLSIHAIQAWLEIARHPGLYRARWPGAATILFLAVYLGVFAWNTLRPVAAAPKAGSPSPA
jgi:tetratricopeptide (TPR) repeat protein